MTDYFIPDQRPREQALARTTHLGIGAHQDDLEFMALHGILECFQHPQRAFGAITCTDGAGSSRTGIYADYSNEDMIRVRAEEQRIAAQIGRYAFMAQLGHPSRVLKDPASRREIVVPELVALIDAARPEVIYTHNPVDKHATHINVLLAVLEACQQLPADARPTRLLGCEVWRGLDWVPDSSKVVLNVGAHPNLAASLNGVFDSQITGGKRYDLAVEGRRRANATFFQSHAVDEADQVTFALDLSCLLKDDSPGLQAYVNKLLQDFRDEVISLLPGNFV